MQIKITRKFIIVSIILNLFLCRMAWTFILDDIFPQQCQPTNNVNNFKKILSDSKIPIKEIKNPQITKNKKYKFIDIEEKRKLFIDKKFSEIEKYYSKCLETRLDYDSRHNMTTFIWLLNKKVNNFDLLLDEWEKEIPKSHIPHLIRACILINKAWEARGTGWASTVTKEGWDKMNKNLKSSQTELEKAYELNPADPNIGATGIIVSMGLCVDLSVTKSWFDRSMNSDPYHTSAYAQMMTVLFPKWHGSWKLAKSVVDDALKKTDYNPQLFALLPLYYEEFCRRKTDNEENVKLKFKSEYRKVYNTILKKAYEEASEKYPDEFQVQARYGIDALNDKDRELGLKKIEQVIKLIEAGKTIDLPYFSSFNCSICFVYNKYAWILSTSKNENHYQPKRALIYARKAVELEPEWEWGLDTLANAYAANGDFTSAIETQKKAMEFGNETFKRTSNRKISQFEEGIAPRY